MKTILLILSLTLSASAATLYPVLTDGSARLLPGGQTNWVTANGTNVFSGTNTMSKGLIVSIADGAAGTVAQDWKVDGTRQWAIVRNTEAGNDASNWRMLIGADASLGWAAAWGAVTVRNAANTADANIKANLFLAESAQAANFSAVGDSVYMVDDGWDVAGVHLKSTGGFIWHSGVAGSGAGDTMLSRNAAGIVEINNGTAGTFRDLTLRNLNSTGNLSVPSGANSRAGNATLVAGTIAVAVNSVTDNSIVMLTRKTSGGTIGTEITYTLSAGTGFTITSDSVLDTSVFSYFVIENP